LIVAAGLSPAWQQALELERFVPGQVNRAAHSLWCASGKVVNVAIGLQMLGAACRGVLPLGGDTGLAVAKDLESLGVACEVVRCRAATRVCTTILDGASGATTELVPEAATLEADELAEFAARFRTAAATAEMVVLSGSLPPGTPASYYRELLSATTARAVLDVRGPELIEALACRPLVVKPNRRELEKTVGRPLVTQGALVAAMRELNAAGAEWVAVTDGANDVLLTSSDRCYALQPPRVERVVNAIGCGDSMTAAMAWALCGGRDMVDAVRLGVAAAAQNLGSLLPARLDATTLGEIASSVVVREM
jgi:1-phosphofructokinase family hexose kinase